MIATDRELLDVEEVAEYFGVGPVTIYRWCREGRLPCAKLGKHWRIRRAALEDFLRRGEQGRTLVSQLNSFFNVPDQVLAIAENQALLRRLDAAFFQVGEARGGMLVKLTTGEAAPAEELRADFERHGLDVARLEAEGRFRFVGEEDAQSGREQALQRLIAERTDEEQSVWVSFDWVKQIGLDEALRQQEELEKLVDTNKLVLKTALLEQVVDEWSPHEQRQMQYIRRGMITLSIRGMVLSRVSPLPAL